MKNLEKRVEKLQRKVHEHGFVLGLQLSVDDVRAAFEDGDNISHGDAISILYYFMEKEGEELYKLQLDWFYDFLKQTKKENKNESNGLN